MSSLEARRLNHLETAIRAASGEQIVTIEHLVAEVASMRVAEVALARRTEVTGLSGVARTAGPRLLTCTARTRTTGSGSVVMPPSVAARSPP
jgi:hypothetical protein